MNEDKKSFVVYCDYKEHLYDLTNEEAGLIFKALLEYGDTGEEQTFEDRTLKHVFMMFRRQMDRDAEKWNSVKAKRSAAGKKGGQKSAQVRAEKNKPLHENTENVSVFKQIKQSQANQAVNVNVNVNDNVNVNVNDNVIQLADDLLRPLEKAVGTSYERDRNEIEQLIAIKLEEGYTEEEMRKVIDYKCEELKNKSKEERADEEIFFHPSFLFGDAFSTTLELMGKEQQTEEVNDGEQCSRSLFTV